MESFGRIYVFTSNGAFFMNKSDYGDDFINNTLIYLGDWNLINVYFCDFLIINPKIYDSFVSELCKRNINDFWFQTAMEIYKDKYCK